MVLKQATKLVAAGVAIGLAAAIVLQLVLERRCADCSTAASCRNRCCSARSRSRWR